MSSTPAWPLRRVALVTGANRGIGQAIANGLAEQGMTVLLTARDLDKARAAAEPLLERGLAVLPRQLDVTDADSIDAVRQEVEREIGRLDVLVNNAAAVYDTDQVASTADMGLVQAALESNLLGPWRLCQAFVPLMRRQGFGRIVNVSSGSGSFDEERGPETPTYSVTKTGLNMLTVKLAAELRGSGILVNAVCPGWVHTEMGGPAAPLTPQEGADTPIWLATLPNDGPTGGFFRRRKRISW